jgi:hypothetical protein
MERENELDKDGILCIVFLAIGGSGFLPIPNVL